ncbi:MAG: hypothetical protein ABIH99_05730 [Candidatus Micrarchaeota archaeon]
MAHGINKAFLGIFALFLASILLAGCINSSPSVSEAAQLIPDKATDVIVINVNEILNDKEVLSTLSSGNSEQAFASIKQNTGIDAEKVETLVVFSDANLLLTFFAGKVTAVPSTTSSSAPHEVTPEIRTLNALIATTEAVSSEEPKEVVPVETPRQLTPAVGALGSTEQPYLGVILKGSFDKEEIVSILKNSNSLQKETTYGGYTIYSNAAQDNCVVFLGDSFVVSGTLEAVQDVIDISNGNGKALDANVIGKYSEKINTDAWVLAIFSMPDEMKEALSASESSSFDARALASINELAFSYSKSESTHELKLALYCESANSAGEISILLNGLVETGLNSVESNSMSKTLLNRIVFSQEDIFVLSSVSASSEELNLLYAELNKATQYQTPRPPPSDVPIRPLDESQRPPSEMPPADQNVSYASAVSSCAFPKTFGCKIAELKSSGEMTIEIANLEDEEVKLIGVSCTIPGTQFPIDSELDDTHEAKLAPGDSLPVTIVKNICPAGASGEKFTGEIMLKYAVTSELDITRSITAVFSASYQ